MKQKEFSKIFGLILLVFFGAAILGLTGCSDTSKPPGYEDPMEGPPTDMPEPDLPLPTSSPAPLPEVE